MAKSTVNQSIRQRWANLFKDLVKQNGSIIHFSASFGRSSQTISNYCDQDYQIDPMKIDFQTWYLLANHLGWSIDRLYAYVEGREYKEPSDRSSDKDFTQLSPLEKLNVIEQLTASLKLCIIENFKLQDEEEDEYESMSFPVLLSSFIGNEVMSLADIAKTTGIDPRRIVKFMSDVEVPTEDELIKISQLNKFPRSLEQLKASLKN